MTTTTIDFAAVKTRQQATWASGDYSRIATLIVPVAERLCDSADLVAGSSVLDVACGSGNATIAAARLGARVSGLDYVESLLERAQERADVERVEVELFLGDAEALPFSRASFDAVLSVFGTMFAPDHEQTAAEMVRVCRPGGTIALASWSPDGFLGALFATVARHVPPPAGVRSPMLWGDPGHLDELFGNAVRWTHTERKFTFRFASAEALVETFATYYGPTLRAIEAAGTALEDDLRALVKAWSRLPDGGPVAVPGAYLESIGRRR
jgi:ubiquinone/menaquinone biosynthesis C-methylase UbiE